MKEQKRCRFFIQAKSPNLFPPILCDATGKSSSKDMRANCPIKQFTNFQCFMLGTAQASKRVQPQIVAIGK